MFYRTRTIIPSIYHRLTPISTRCRLSSRSFFTSTLLNKRDVKTPNYQDQSNQTNIISSPIQDYPITESFLPHYLMENWHKFPNKTALINGEAGEKMSYAELQTKITKLGSALTRQGFGKGDVMTIISPNCPEFCLICLAAAAIGMTVSAVNPQYTQGHQPLDGLLQDDGKAFPENISYNLKEDTLILPYSSGTSGSPKGVMLTSYSIVSNLIQICNPDILDVQHDDVYLCVLPLYHIFAQVVIMFGGFRYGTTIVTMSKFDPVAYLDNIQKYQITHLHVVPPIMMFLGNHPILDKYDFSSVQQCFFSAAPAPLVVIEQFKNRFGEKVILNQGYGMTELSPASHVNPKLRRRPDTVGTVLPNAQFKIRDIETNQSLPAYKEGEICVKGPQMMKGYFKNDKATSETIIDGWLHTGDVGYYDEDGYTVITDRIKELIKVKGFQVAPAELEDLLLTHPAVQDVAVIGKPDDVAGELPRAYIVLKPEAKATEEDITNYVKEKAAPYKQLKGGVQFRKEIPKSASGKILKRILKDELRQGS